MSNHQIISSLSPSFDMCAMDVGDFPRIDKAWSSNSHVIKNGQKDWRHLATYKDLQIQAFNLGVFLVGTCLLKASAVFVERSFGPLIRGIHLWWNRRNSEFGDDASGTIGALKPYSPLRIRSDYQPSVNIRPPKKRWWFCVVFVLGWIFLKRGVKWKTSWPMFATWRCTSKVQAGDGPFFFGGGGWGGRWLANQPTNQPTNPP